MLSKAKAGTQVDDDLVPFDVDRPAVEAARRDPRAFEPLYRKYVAQVYSFALYETRDQHTAEDLTEGVFLRALSALPRFRQQAVSEGGTFRGWLFTIARNALANERRRRRRHPEASLELAAHLADDSDPAHAVELRLEGARAWRAVMALPTDKRQAIVLRFVNELSAREVGAVMGRSEGAARVLIHRAVRSVRRLMEASPQPGRTDTSRPGSSAAVHQGRPGS